MFWIKVTETGFLLKWNTSQKGDFSRNGSPLKTGGKIFFREESRFRRNPVSEGIPFREEFRGRDPRREEFLGRDPGGRSFLGGIPLGRSSKAPHY